jgi:hypothetical protein
MPIDNPDIKTHIALLEKDVTQVNSFVEKLDSAIEKLTDVSSSIKELLAIHDHKLTQQSEVNIEIYNVIKQLKEENHREHRETKDAMIRMDHRLDALENWKFTMIGGTAVASAFLSIILNHIIHTFT